MAQLFSLGGMNPLAIFLLLGWLWTLLGHGSYRATLPLSYRIQNIVLSFLLVASASTDLWGFWWRVFHADLLPAFFTRESVFHPVAGIIIAVLSVCAAHLEVFIGYWMAQQRRRARRFVTSAMPYLLAVQILSGIRTSAKFRPEVASIGLFVFVPMVIGFYVWLYLFCKSKQTEELMTNAA